MANKITNTLVANITAQDDSTQNISINRGNQNPSFDSVLAQMSEYVVLANGANVIPLPTAICFQLYVKNNDPALIITPTITPNGGVAAIYPKLYPGEQLIIWCSNANAAGGFTALTLGASGAGALVEYFIGA